MEAKDTVIRTPPEDLPDICLSYKNAYLLGCQAQAEVSFKAGRLTMTRRIKEQREAEYPRPQPILGGMKLEKAIKLLESFTLASNTFAKNDVDDALKLGIEALKRIKLQRSPRGFGYSYKLPGEEADDAKSLER